VVRQCAKAIGHVSWWIFVVATLYAGGVYWWGSHRGIGAPVIRDGTWSVYIPFIPGAGYEDIPAGRSYAAWHATSTDNWDAPSTYAMIAFVVVVLAALVDAAILRRAIPGIVTVAVPFISLGFFVLATPDTFDGTQLKWQITMLITLAAIAIREIWTRALLPRITSTQGA